MEFHTQSQLMRHWIRKKIWQTSAMQQKDQERVWIRTVPRQRLRRPAINAATRAGSGQHGTAPSWLGPVRRAVPAWHGRLTRASKHGTQHAGPPSAAEGRRWETGRGRVMDALIPAAQLPPWRASTPRRGPASMMDGVVTTDGGGAEQIRGGA